LIIRIHNLKLRAVIGLNEWERKTMQDVTINLDIVPKSASSADTDDASATVNYKKVKDRIMDEVESSRFKLIERLAGFILDMVMEDPNVASATVKVDKPHALRFADSVSVELTRNS